MKFSLLVPPIYHKQTLIELRENQLLITQTIEG
jgi:hypothetical protein